MGTNPVFIIAEMSANHNHHLNVAIDTIKAAKKAGADAIKMQTYTADTITLNCKHPEFVAGDIWKGQTLYDLYKQAYTPWEWHEELFRVAREEGLVCFSTPFDPTAVDLLESLGNPIYKVASFEITDIPLIKYIASKHKPIILSTGIAMEEDIRLALEIIRGEGNNDITLLKCTSAYPAPIEDANLLTIPDMKTRFGVKVGLSDHTEGATVPIAAVALGAEVIEKHFTLDKTLPGNDHYHGGDPEDFKKAIANFKWIDMVLGSPEKTVLDCEIIPRREARRSLVLTRDMKAGEVIKAEDLMPKRPGTGISPRFVDIVIGRKVNQDLAEDTILTWDMV